MNGPKDRAASEQLHRNVTGMCSNEAAGQEQGKAAVSVAQSGRANPLRVLVVDDHPIVRRGLISCLAGCKHLEVVGEAGNGKEAIAKTRALTPDVVLMDIDMPKLDGLAATEVLRRENPNSTVLLISEHNDSQYVLRMMRSGANGYVSKETSPTELVQAVETVGAGKSFWGQHAALVSQMLRRDWACADTKKLSPRECQVLAAIAEGLTNKEVSSRLNIGVRTVETHRERIMRKLNIRTVAGLTRFAISTGLITLRSDPPEKQPGQDS